MAVGAVYVFAVFEPLVNALGVEYVGSLRENSHSSLEFMELNYFLSREDSKSSRHITHEVCSYFTRILS